MNQKRTVSLIALFSLFALLLTGLTACGAPKEVDIETLPEAIVAAVDFEDELTEINEFGVKNMYMMPDGTTGRVFLGSGATAEEVSVFQCQDEAAAKEMLEAANTHIQSRIAKFQDYEPAQVPLLENALVKQVGNAVVVCVAKDTAPAAKLI